MPRCQFDEDEAGASAWVDAVTPVASRTSRAVYRVQHIQDSVAFDGSGFGDVDIAASLADVDRSVIMGVPGYSSDTIAVTRHYYIETTTNAVINAPALAGLTRTVYLTIVEYY